MLNGKSVMLLGGSGSLGNKSVRTGSAGTRPGEKPHQFPTPLDAARNTLEPGGHHVIKPNFNFIERRLDSGGRASSSEDFRHDSETAPAWLGLEKIRDVLAKNDL